MAPMISTGKKRAAERWVVKRISGEFALIAAALGVFACAGELQGNEADYRVGNSSAVQGCDRAIEIFESECTSCHDPVSKYGGLDLETADVASRLVGKPSSDPNCASRLLIDPDAP